MKRLFIDCDDSLIRYPNEVDVTPLGVHYGATYEVNKPLVRFYLQPSQQTTSQGDGLCVATFCLSLTNGQNLLRILRVGRSNPLSGIIPEHAIRREVGQVNSSNTRALVGFPRKSRMDGSTFLVRAWILKVEGTIDGL